jgi:lipoprotein-releasing system ATP-binding protein
MGTDGRQPNGQGAAEAILAVEHLAKSYHDGTRELAVLRDVNLSLQAGETLAILGRSGTGKSTLLHLFGLLDRPSRGSLRLLGSDAASLPEAARTRLRSQAIGFVFQQYHLIEEFDAVENVALAAAVGRVGSLGGANRTRARELLSAVGLADREKHRPRQLSGGEQQRVAIARALLGRPALLLCDEPTGNLDPATGDQVLQVLWQAVKRERTAMILVTHDTAVANRADRALRLEAGSLRPA